MRFGAAFWIQRTTWDDLHAACLAAEAAGWDSIWVDDHLLADEGDWADPKLEAWTTLAAIAARTQSVRLGLMVGATTFRNPGLTAKLATTIDQISDGRAVLGMGAGWFRREHEAFGLTEFGSGFGERLDRLDEAASLVRRLLDGERVTHHGRFYRFADAVCAPRPVQDHLPLLIGGVGTKTLRTTANYADIWNGYGEERRITSATEELRQNCEAMGRPFEEIERTVTVDVVMRDDELTARRAYAELESIHGLAGRVGYDGTPRGLGYGGPPGAIAEFLRPFVDLGIREVEWIFRWPFDHQTIERIGEVRQAVG
jgi:alkanesulfonate monooxygenase SsuD/methylene tetrahydromethanopterin reductase-like flavin-dependent oxidoreductase (luciferase family)